MIEEAHTFLPYLAFLSLWHGQVTGHSTVGGKVEGAWNPSLMLETPKTQSSRLIVLITASVDMSAFLFFSFSVFK